MSGIYIHIPFCKKSCSYCDFHFSTNVNSKKTIVDHLKKEISLRKNELISGPVNSIYFGGGTPSLLDEAELNSILQSIRENFKINPNAEITFEANPDDITKNSLQIWKKNGINRLSIGVQSFLEEELKWMNRAHDAKSSETSVKMAQDNGFDNITIDLIYGSKFQSMLTWERTLQKALDLKTQHISSYNLTIEQKTLLGTNFKKGLEPAVNDELSSRQFVLMSEFLSANGFVHYEISNFGKENYFSLHNSNYWRGEHYLGLGPSAHSYNGTERRWNVSSNSAYLQHLDTGTPFFEKEILTTENKFNEYVMTRLRTIWGADLAEIKKLFGEKIAQDLALKARSHPDHILEKNNIFTLNLRGRLLADKLSAEFFI
jgi:oxygen-independent coproporphyrinogen-3 oxidase